MIQAGSAEEGLKLLALHPIQLVVTDYSLPGETGVWMLKEAHRRGILRGDPLIVTAHFRLANGTGFTVMQKPVELDAFVEAVLGRLRPAKSGPQRNAAVLFAVDAGSLMALTAEQRDLSIVIATRAAKELGPRDRPGLYRRIEQGLAVLYRFDRALSELTVLEVRPSAR